jgi:hypothetical protein
MRASRKKEHILQKENTKGNKEEAVCASIQRGHILQSAHEQGTIGEEEEEALLAVDAFLGDLLSGGGGGLEGVHVWQTATNKSGTNATTHGGIRAVAPSDDGCVRER